MMNYAVRETSEERNDHYIDGVWFSYTWSEIFIDGVWYGIYEDAEGNEFYSN